MSVRRVNGGAGERRGLVNVEYPRNFGKRIAELEAVTTLPRGGVRGGGDPNFGFPPEVPLVIGVTPHVVFDGTRFILSFEVELSYPTPVPQGFRYIEAEIDGNGGFHATPRLTPYETPWTIEDVGFEPDQEYQMRVRAVTSRGAGNWGDWFTGITFGPTFFIPTAPTNLRLDTSVGEGGFIYGQNGLYATGAFVCDVSVPAPLYKFTSWQTADPLGTRRSELSTEPGAQFANMWVGVEYHVQVVAVVDGYESTPPTTMTDFTVPAPTVNPPSGFHLDTGQGSGGYQYASDATAYPYLAWTPPSPAAHEYELWIGSQRLIVDGSVTSLLWPYLLSVGSSYTAHIRAFRYGLPSSDVTCSFTVPSYTGTNAPVLDNFTNGRDSTGDYWVKFRVTHSGDHSRGGYLVIGQGIALDPGRVEDVPGNWTSPKYFTYKRFQPNQTYSFTMTLYDALGFPSAPSTTVNYTVTPSPAKPPPSQIPAGTDEAPLGEWKPTLGTVSDFLLDNSVAAYSGEYALKMSVPASAKREIESFDIEVSPGEQWSAGLVAKRGSGTGTAPTATGSVRFYNQDRSAQVGVDTTILSTFTPSTTFNTMTPVQVTVPAGAYRMVIAPFAQGQSGASTYSVWWGLYVRQVVGSKDITSGAVDFTQLASGVVDSIPGGSLGTGLILETNDAVTLVSHVNRIFAPNASLIDAGGGVVTFDPGATEGISVSNSFSNSSAENTLVSLGIPDNRLVEGQVIRMRATGRIGNAISGHTTTVKIKVGGTTVFTINVANIPSIGTPWLIDLTLTVRSGLSVWGYVTSRFNNSGSDQSVSSATSIGSSGINIDITEQFSGASTADFNIN